MVWWNGCTTFLTELKMGVRNYLIEGVSGAGKTAVCTELQRRGYQAIHGDRELVYRGDPETGLPTAPEAATPTATWMSEHQIWDVAKVQAFVANQAEEVTFFCGSSRNFTKFIVKLPRFRGHRTICVRGVHNGQDKRSLPT
jgi:adenylate kinase family enzyme